MNLALVLAIIGSIIIYSLGYPWWVAIIFGFCMGVADGIINKEKKS